MTAMAVNDNGNVFTEKKKNKDQYRIIRNCHEIIYSDIFLPLPSYG